MLKHIVFFKFKDGVTDSEITDLEARFSALPAVIDTIKQYEFGRDVVRSERSCDFALVSAFEDLEAMQQYQTHPEHVKLVGRIKEMCDSILAVDFEAAP